MKLDGVTIPIEERDFGETSDLALRLYFTDLRHILAIVAFGAVPGLALAYLAPRYTPDGFLVTLAYLYLAMPIVGGVIVAGEGPRAFGESLSAGRAWRAFKPHFASVIARIYPVRLVILAVGAFLYASEPASLALVLIFVPFVSSSSTFVREAIVLEKLQGERLRRRIKDLRRSDVGGGAFGRYLQMLGLYAVTCGLLFLLVDLFCGYVLRYPIFLSRFTWENAFRSSVYLLRGDVRVVVVLQMIFWAVYPWARLTLFLSYLDQRIRRECWDLELDARIQAAKLEGLQ